MIDVNQFGFGDWKLVEFSEQVMFVEFGWVEKCQCWLVFFGWMLYLMNICYDLCYLEGGEQYFGDCGQVYILVCKGYVVQCLNLVWLLVNLCFDLDMENCLMSDVLEGMVILVLVICVWFKVNLQVFEVWL